MLGPGAMGPLAQSSRRVETPLNRAGFYDAVVNVAELFSDKPSSAVAFIDAGVVATYGDFDQAVSRIQGAMQRRCQPGDAVAIVGPPSIDFVEMVVAGLRAGLSVLPLDPRYPMAELRRALDLADVSLLVATDETPLADLAIDTVDASELLNAPAPPSPNPPASVDADSAALLMFTSGTAGDPRIAVLTHGNIAASVEQAVSSADELTAVPHVTLGVMPLSHVLGLVSVVAVSLRVGATVVMSRDPNVEAVAQQVQQHGVTLLVAPPIFWYRLSESDTTRGDFASVRLAVSGAAPLSGSLARKIADQFGIAIHQAYGLTEASPGLTSAVGTDAPANSVGRPLPGVELRLVDEFGDDAVIGDVGEVWARGANVFPGYLNDPDATAAVLDEDGWLRTGDLAVVDERGFLFIVGRSKDQIIVAGFNVHPGEVEELLVTHPTVDAAAVVGEPDREYGEVVVAYIVASEGQTTDFDALAAHCRTKLAGYKCPSRFELVTELPRGMTGKVRRRTLRA